MSFSNLKESKNNYKIKPCDIYEKLYKGACIKIRNSKKTFQVIGINPKGKVCWIREWPFDLSVNKTFSLEINQIKVQTVCSKIFTEK